MSDDNRTHFYSIEYIDEEGDICIKHDLLTQRQVEMLINTLASNGISATCYRLSGHMGVISDVNSLEKLLESELF
jgi:hypothetical protein